LFAPVGKSVHFLADDVRQFADAAGKQRSLFKDRSTDFFVVELMEDLADGLFDELPSRCFCRENIFGAFDCSVIHSSHFG